MVYEGIVNKLYGMQVIVNDNLTMDSPRRIHRKKRIQKKWNKRYGFKKIPSNKLYAFNNFLIGRAEVVDKIPKVTL